MFCFNSSSMPLGTPSKENVTFVDSDDWSSVIVIVALCPIDCMNVLYTERVHRERTVRP